MMIGGALAVALAGCQSTEIHHGAAAAEPEWRVVERTGEARLRRPGGIGWAPVMAGGGIAAASDVATGAGGRLIVATSGIQIAAGTGASFVLADPDERPVRQDAGRLRYRVDRTTGAPFVVETAFMRIKTGRAVFDVAIGPDGGEVIVETGRVLVMTADGTRGATLEAGQTAYAGALQGARLMVRRGGDEPARAVEAEPVSVEPRRATAAVHAIARATLERDPAISSPMQDTPAPPVSRAPEPAIVSAGYREEATPAARHDPPPLIPAAKPADEVATVVDERRAGFERLTAGLLESLARAASAPEARLLPRSRSL